VPEGRLQLSFNSIETLPGFTTTPAMLSILCTATSRLHAVLSSLLLVFAMLASGNAPAETVVPTPTNLQSNNERIISYRHQERMWQTTDGALHLVINRGTLDGGGLALFSSFDGGRQWVLAMPFASTGHESTVDGELRGTLLSLVIGEAAGTIRHQVLQYDTTTRIWMSRTSEPAVVSAELHAINPTAITDRQGIVWCAFLARDRASGNHSLRLARRSLDGTWSLASDVLGGSGRSKARSARPMLTPEGVGIAFRVRNVLWWASRIDGAGLSASWDQRQINVDTAEPDLNDPFASHFSAVTDDSQAIHLVLVDDGNVLYFRRDPVLGSWSAPRAIDDPRRSVYVKIGWNGSKIVVSIPTNAGSGVVLTSVDGGSSFVEEHSLVVPPPTAGITYEFSRHEMPSRWSGALPILQQYEQRRQERLMLYEILVP
jgi:hypothetical protein